MLLGSTHQYQQLLVYVFVTPMEIPRRQRFCLPCLPLCLEQGPAVNNRLLFTPLRRAVTHRVGIGLWQ